MNSEDPVLEFAFGKTSRINKDTLELPKRAIVAIGKNILELIRQCNKECFLHILFCFVIPNPKGEESGIEHAENSDSSLRSE